MKFTRYITGLCFLLCALLTMLPACTSVPTANELALIKTVSAEAAYVGAAIDLKDHPANRPKYVLALAALNEMIAHDSYSPASLQAALAQLPALRGADGAVIDAGATLFLLVKNLFVDLDTVPRVQAAAIGIANGLADALARPTGPATRALAGDLPKQCEVPARPAQR